MTYLVIIRCGSNNKIFQFDDRELYSRFDKDQEEEEILKEIEAYIEKLHLLDNKYDLTPEQELFLQKEFGSDESYWKPADTSELQFISGYFDIIQTGTQ